MMIDWSYNVGGFAGGHRYLNPWFIDGPIGGLGTTLIRTHVSDTTVLLASNAFRGRLYYHWFVNGRWVKGTELPTYTHQGKVSDQDEVRVIATTNADYDGPANVPRAYPPTRTLEWKRSLGAAVKYRIQQATGQGSPSEGDWGTDRFEVDNGADDYRHTTGQLTDLTWYWWRVQPVDAAGNVGAALTFGPEFIVIRPDVPDKAVTFSDSTQKVTVEA